MTTKPHSNRQLIPDIQPGGGIFAWALISAFVYLAIAVVYMLL